jgi:hypothetical protein
MAADFLDRPSVPRLHVMTAALLGSLKCGGYPAGPPPNAFADKCRDAISGWSEE